MRRALALARRGEGLTRPNPPVGALVVKAGRAIGAGFHARAGGPHAEVIALEAAGAGARGASLYVTLEPCCTHGRTPPCVDAIIKAKVREVIVGARDPNPKHCGRGLAALRRAGIRVIENVCRAEAENLIAPFAKWITTGLPFFTLKLGVSLDGKIADTTGKSKWITSAASRKAVQAMRRRSDAIMVGAGTLRADNPGLLPRPALGRKPMRIVVSSSGRIPARSKVFIDAECGRAVVAVAKHCAIAAQKALAGSASEVWAFRQTRSGIDLRALARKLGEQGILHVLCEGGGELTESLIRAGLADELVFFVAPKIIGGGEAHSAVKGVGWPLGKGPELDFLECRKSGPDILIRARPRAGRQPGRKNV